MPYKIEIKHTQEVPATLKEYKKIADTGNKDDNGPVYGYVETDSVRKIETDVLIQTVDELNLPDVIRAINGL